jgi:long-chain acyl-CoA synthetase
LGLDVSVLADMRPDKQRTALDTSKATILYATPTQLRLLAKGNIRPLEHIRLILCGGGQLDQNTAKSISALCPNAQVRVFYGAAETSFITLSDADTPLGSVGRAYPHVCIEMRGELGEIWVKSPYLFDGYGTTQPGILHDKDGFISIGELGKIDEDGTLSLLGRKTRVVTIADQNVHLESIEQTLNAHPAVDICAVLARPHAQKGHTLTAIIEGPPDAVLADQLQRHCRTTLNALVTPKTVLFIDTLPVLASGKTDLIALTKWLEQHP